MIFKLFDVILSLIKITYHNRFQSRPIKFYNVEEFNEIQRLIILILISLITPLVVGPVSGKKEFLTRSVLVY